MSQITEGSFLIVKCQQIERVWNRYWLVPSNTLKQLHQESCILGK